MKLNELVNFYKTAPDSSLKEHVEQNNDTRFLAEDVVKIIRTSQDPNVWSNPMSGNELIAILESMSRKAGNVN